MTSECLKYKLAIITNRYLDGQALQYIITQPRLVADIPSRRRFQLSVGDSWSVGLLRLQRLVNSGTQVFATAAAHILFALPTSIKTKQLLMTLLPAPEYRLNFHIPNLFYAERYQPNSLQK
jgi:hypothetical protein